MALTEQQGLEAALSDINNLIAITLRQIAALENSRLAADQKEQLLADLQAELARYKVGQARLIAALNQLNFNNQRGTASAADTTSQAQVARDDNANPQSPAPPAQKEIAADGRIKGRGTVSETNATQTPTTETGAVDVGTNAEVRKLNVTQSISSPPSKGPLPAPARGAFLPGSQNAESGIYASNSAGATGIGNQNEDRSPPPSTVTQNLLDNLYAENNIVAEANVLDQYPSYTYNLSW